MKTPRERTVWSPEYGGCLMIQRYSPGNGWRDWSSQDEGEYPEHNAQAKRAVRMSNAWRRAAAIKARADAASLRAAVLQTRAATICKRAGISPALVGL